MRIIRVIAVSLLGLTLTWVTHPSSAPAQDSDDVDESPNAEQITFFERHIRPVLIEHCYECHSQESDPIEGGLRLDDRDAVLVGGDSGPALVAGEPSESLILEALRYESFEMPPDQRLDDSVIARFEEWIEAGAADPRKATGEQPVDTNDESPSASEHWAFQPLSVVIPSDAVRHAEVSSPIDRLIWSGDALVQTQVPKLASKELLVRRAYFDLHGVPPTPQQIEAFVNDAAPDAWSKLVDRLLASPRFGERWGRHWLDAARYADSSGGGRAILFPLAYKYRDFVTNSMNQDKPYDEFVRQQIAGDLLPFTSPVLRSENLTALGFLTLGPTNYELQDKELLRMEVVDEQIDTMGRAFLGMSIGCARCHDHKFDPIPTRDYYALAGIFRSTKTLLPGNVSGFVTRELPQSDDAAEAWNAFQVAEQEIKKVLAELQNQKEAADARVSALRSESGLGFQIVVDEEDAELTGNWTASQSIKPFIKQGYHHSSEDGAFAEFEIDVPSDGKYEVRLAYTANPNRASNAAVEVVHSTGSNQYTVDQTQKPSIDANYHSLGEHEFLADSPAKVIIRCDGANGVVIADAVGLLPLDTPMSELAEAIRRDIELEQAKIEAIGESIAAAQNDLKALAASKPAQPERSMGVQDESEIADYFVAVRGNVHRLGDQVPRGTLTGVGYPSEFQTDDKQSGRLELANWIAAPENTLTARVHANRIWHHLFGTGIVSSLDNFGTTGSLPTNPELLDYLSRRLIDSEWSSKSLIREIMLSHAYRMETKLNKEGEIALLREGRQIRRLDAEAIRDSILMISRRIDTRIGGLSFDAKLKSEFGGSTEGDRRSIYLPTFRNNLNELLETFDFANPNLVSGGRKTTTLPTQALYMMNSQWVRAMSEHTSSWVIQEYNTDEARLAVLVEAILGREPSQTESTRLLGFAQKSRETGASELVTWSVIAQSLYASLDFRFLQ